MGSMLNLAFSIVKFVFKTVFWIVGILTALLIGSCPD